jgi:hypothetical protein
MIDDSSIGWHPPQSQWIPIWFRLLQANGIISPRKQRSLRNAGPRSTSRSTLLANGHSPHKIWKLTGIESDVVRRIRELNPETLANLKTSLATSLAEASQLLAERGASGPSRRPTPAQSTEVAALTASNVRRNRLTIQPNIGNNCD